MSDSCVSKVTETQRQQLRIFLSCHRRRLIPIPVPLPVPVLLVICYVWHCLVVGLAFSHPTQMSHNVIDTQYGKIRGVLINFPNRNLPPVEAYFGIQYASVLGGELRFMPPTSSMEKWEGIRVALRFRPVCPQKLPDLEEMEKRMPRGRVEHFHRILGFLEKQSEDCLNLNIYVPVRERNDTKPLSVLVFFHGETFEMGTGNAYDGSAIAAFGQVIVVTLNYRLGILGFLSTGDSNAPGNYALLDQVAALHWIKENIAAFNGDPNSVTLLGHGYGGAMVNLLLVSPVTKGRNLFQKAIIQSGSALGTWSTTSDPLRYAKELAERFNCSQPTPAFPLSTGLLQCLKQVPVETLIRADIRAPKYFSPFGPTVDKRSVLPTDIRRLMSKPGECVFANIRLLLGVTRNEGFIYFSEREVDDGISGDRYHQMLRTYVQNVYSYHRQYIYDILVHQYTAWDRSSDATVLRDSMMELIGDGQQVAPVIEMAQLHARVPNAPTYVYSFNYPTRLDAYPRWAGGIHGDDMAFVFGAPLTDGIDPFPSVYTRSDRFLAETVLRYWTNFIKTGNPNEPGDHSRNKATTEPEWPPYDLEKQEFLHIERRMQDRLEEATRPVVRHHYRGAKMALWLDLIPRIHQQDNLDPHYHLLDDYNNLTSFEEEGTRLIRPEDLISTTLTTELTTSTSTSVSMTLSTDSTSSQSTTLTTAISTATEVTSTTTPWPLLSTSVRSFPSSDPVRGTTIHPQKFSDDETTGSDWDHSSTGREGHSDGGHTLSLSVTIAVGCSLLFLNIVIFVGVYHQKARLRQERRLMKIELEQERDVIVGHHSSSSCAAVDHPRPNAYTNCASTHVTRIPPAPLPVAASRQAPHPPQLLLPPPGPINLTRVSIPVAGPSVPHPSTRRSTQYIPRLQNKLQCQTTNETSGGGGGGSGGGGGGILKHSKSIDAATGNRANHIDNPSTVV